MSLTCTKAASDYFVHRTMLCFITYHQRHKASWQIPQFNHICLAMVNLPFSPCGRLYYVVFCVCRSEVGAAALSNNGGDGGFLPGPADPWHKAGGPVQCWYQHFGARPKSECQHGQWEQEPWARTTNPCAGAGWLPGVLWCGCKLLLSWCMAACWKHHRVIYLLFTVNCDKSEVSHTDEYVLL